MDPKRHIIVVTGLLGLSCLVQVAVIRRAEVTGLDAVLTRSSGGRSAAGRQAATPGLRRRCWNHGPYVCARQA